MGQLEGKTALITGAALGIGLAVAKRAATANPMPVPDPVTRAVLPASRLIRFS